MIEAEEEGSNLEVTLVDFSRKDASNLAGINIKAKDSNGFVKVETLDKYDSLLKECREFNFNSAEDFSPDADASKVSEKLWDWLLNPLKF